MVQDRETKPGRDVMSKTQGLEVKYQESGTITWPEQVYHQLRSIEVRLRALEQKIDKLEKEQLLTGSG